MTYGDENVRHLHLGSATASEEEGTHFDERVPTDEDSSSPKAVLHFSPAERAARGRAARGDVPRSAHADWEPGPMRRDPVDLLEEQAESRLPELGPIRYGRMLASPFTFFRGAAYLMAADLADGARTGLHAQLCGDAHLSNFGIFAAPDRRLVFSINDFDETLPGPFEWDVKRLAASFAVAGRDRGFNAAIRRSVVMAAVREYREAIARFAEMRNIDLWYTRLDVADIQEQLGTAASKNQMKRFQAQVAKAHTKDSLRALTKLCRTVDGELRIVGRPPLVTPIEDVLPGAEQDHLEDVVRRMIDTYRRALPRDRRTLLESYRYVHAARKVVGVGSVGARAWILLMVGRDHGDPLFLQFKEAQASVLEPFLGRSQYAHHGQRVVEGQRMMQAAPDILLGWERIETIDGQEKDFYIRQLWDAKGSAEVELMDPSGLEAYGRVCGWTLARAHARSGDRIAIAAYLGSGDVFDRAMATFAETYADQNDRDYHALQEAVASGRVRGRDGRLIASTPVNAARPAAAQPEAGDPSRPRVPSCASPAPDVPATSSARGVHVCGESAFGFALVVEDVLELVHRARRFADEIPALLWVGGEVVHLEDRIGRYAGEGVLCHAVGFVPLVEPFVVVGELPQLVGSVWAGWQRSDDRFDMGRVEAASNGLPDSTLFCVSPREMSSSVMKYNGEARLSADAEPVIRPLRSRPGSGAVST